MPDAATPEVVYLLIADFGDSQITHAASLDFEVLDRKRKALHENRMEACGCCEAPSAADILGATFRVDTARLVS